MPTVETLYTAVQQLSLPDQEELVDRLLADRSGDGSSLHPAWADELKRRSAEIDAGAVALIPWEQVRDAARAAAGLGGPAGA